LVSTESATQLPEVVEALLLAEDDAEEAADELLDAAEEDELLDEEDPLPSPQAATVAIVPAEANHISARRRARVSFSRAGRSLIRP
jgi:hypothetical protein